MDMNNNRIATLPEGDSRARSYNVDTDEKDLKGSSKSELIGLLLKRERDGQANEFENSIVPQPKQEGLLPSKGINSYEGLIIKPPE